MIIAVNAEVTGSNPVEALIFFRLLLSNCLNWKIYCDDHSSLSLKILAAFFKACSRLLNSRDEAVKGVRSDSVAEPGTGYIFSFIRYTLKKKCV